MVTFFIQHWAFIQTMIELIALIGACAIFGMVGVMRKTIDALHEYVGSLEQNNKNLREENERYLENNHMLHGQNVALEGQISAIHARIDNVHGVHLKEIGEIKQILDTYQP